MWDFWHKVGASLSAGVIGLSASVLESGTSNYVLDPQGPQVGCWWRTRDLQSYQLSRLSPLLHLSVVTPVMPLYL
jgi:hypothetical protein